ncbi:TIGR04282 family arsenosugar biosynthesis glycosyltransferase [Companilactobacillus mishanensis]|uniref:Glycosyltransferase n=1 Tax=Companilactobacillus mishanensis TaxID=2486008 RepID=A0A5P0ZG39_9LACO|nr:TIGR04282 family arsenosugar biosynthesis glycosyltransferase [Companilactobacillus mishanensis]MQS45420.1 glycosyltransferase [Companilactobacillus mishanensis]MQS52016.1 glycosyltransferase [Companilactobacillus mishanensis]
MSKNAYIIFSKIPEAGFVKTRMQPDLTPEDSSRIQSRMLTHIIELSESLEDLADVFLVYQAHDERIKNEFLSKVPTDIQTFPQVGEILGNKMSTAIKTVQRMGYDKVVLTGSDIPGLTADVVRSAFDGLTDHDVTLGPTFDGGYYLFGTNDHDSDEFLDADISWSTNSVLETTITLFKQAHKSCFLTDALLDVDFKRDLKQLDNKTVQELL